MVWATDAKFKSVYHKLTGPMQHQPNLLRGRGLPCPKGSLYDRIVIDAHSDFMKKGMSEHSKYIEQYLGPNFGPCKFGSGFIF